MMSSLGDTNVTLFALKARYNTAILVGDKTVELRRALPKRCKPDSLCATWVTGKKKAARGLSLFFTVANVVTLPPHELWLAIGGAAYIHYYDFYDYFRGKSFGHAIFLKDVYQVPHVSFEQMAERFPSFTVPQSFRYLTLSQFPPSVFAEIARHVSADKAAYSPIL